MHLSLLRGFPEYVIVRVHHHSDVVDAMQGMEDLEAHGVCSLFVRVRLADRWLCRITGDVEGGHLRLLSAVLSLTATRILTRQQLIPSFIHLWPWLARIMWFTLFPFHLESRIVLRGPQRIDEDLLLERYDVSNIACNQLTSNSPRASAQHTIVCGKATLPYLSLSNPNALDGDHNQQDRYHSRLHRDNDSFFCPSTRPLWLAIFLQKSFLTVAALAKALVLFRDCRKRHHGEY